MASREGIFWSCEKDSLVLFSCECLCFSVILTVVLSTCSSTRQWTNILVSVCLFFRLDNIFVFLLHFSINFFQFSNNFPSSDLIFPFFSFSGHARRRSMHFGWLVKIQRPLSMQTVDNVDKMSRSVPKC